MKQQKMDLEVRLTIECYIEKGFTINDISTKTGYSNVAIANEIKNHLVSTPRKILKKPTGKFCKYVLSCAYHKSKHNCKKDCLQFEPVKCAFLKKFPFCCNGCPNITCCYLDRKIYGAVEANNVAEKSRVSAHEGPLTINMDELQKINELVSPLIKKGLSLEVIYNKYQSSMPFCLRTFRNYVNKGYFDAKNIDLARTVQRKYSKEYEKRDKTQIKDPKILIGRTYISFQRFSNKNPDENIFEIDTVIGTKANTYCLLTIFHRKSRMQFGLKVPKTAKSILLAFQNLRRVLGNKSFYNIFQILLTDNGTEFNRLHEIERVEGLDDYCSHVFFCNPYSSFQKGGCERNHELIRYKYPKGTSFDELSQEDISDLFSCINSYPRPSLNHSTPYEAFKKMFGENAEYIFSFFRIKQIPFEELKLK